MGMSAQQQEMEKVFAAAEAAVAAASSRMKPPPPGSRPIEPVHPVVVGIVAKVKSDPRVLLRIGG
jgi:hypothetical protein